MAGWRASSHAHRSSQTSVPRHNRTAILLLILMLVQMHGAFVVIPNPARRAAAQFPSKPLKKASLVVMLGNEMEGVKDKSGEEDGTGFSVVRKRGVVAGPGGYEDIGPEDIAELQRKQRQAEQASKMMASGASAAQLSAYTGIKLVELETGFTPKLQETPSHQFVDRDEEGTLKQARFVYVDEYTCIGCTNCAMTAPNTFYMDDEHGRARVFQQWKDRPRTIQTAIETCPVDCIHYVPFEELERLEKERAGMTINYKARLVGSDGLLSSSGGDQGMQEISGNKDFRCGNCPSRGCFNCPMFGVGENPEYQRKQRQIAQKRERRRASKDNSSEGGSGSGGTGRKRVDL